jgi:hypothetical protein
MKRWILGAFLALCCLLDGGSLRADFLFGLSSSTPGTLYNVDPTTGAATSIVSLPDGTGTNFTGLAALNGVLYATDVFSGGAGYFGTIDPRTGAFTALNNQGGSLNWHSLAANAATQTLYTVDLSKFGDNWMLLALTPAGKITQVGSTGIDIRGMAFDPNHMILYGVGFNHVSGGLNLYTMNTTTGQASLIGATGFSVNFRPGLAFDDVHNVLYMNLGEGGDEGNSLYTLDTATGMASRVGPNGPTSDHGIQGITFVATPEPSSLAVLGIGAACVAPFGWRRWKAFAASVRLG